MASKSKVTTRTCIKKISIQYLILSFKYKVISVLKTEQLQGIYTQYMLNVETTIRNCVWVIRMS